MSQTKQLREDNEIIADIKAKHSFYIQQANNAIAQAKKYQAMLEAYQRISGNSVLYEILDNDDEADQKQSDREQSETNSGNSLKDIVGRIFVRENRAMTLNDLFPLVIKEGAIIKDRKTFGVRMAQFKNKAFMNMAINELPNDIKVWWGLPSFFNGSHLKAEYYKPIKQKYRLSEGIFDL